MRQLIRFCIVGCLNFAISFTVFYLSYRYFPLSRVMAAVSTAIASDITSVLRSFGITSIDAAASNVIGFTAGMGNSFVWNKLWTFKVAAGTKKQAGRFVLTNIVCLLVSTGVIFVCTDLNQWPYQPVWLVTMVFVTIINFVLSKYWVFAQK
ncbi:MAG: GtrA family protein [Desulfuromonadaceae bacterium]|nr:GtrA family protein [Desulfuromonadaceae bacterium]MDD5106487.1 GtrA family protein [Desulfuromonadaceae bacterium]